MSGLKIFRFCKKYLLSYKFILIWYIVITLITSAIGIASPYITGSFLDNLIVGDNINIVVTFCIIFAILNISNILLGYIIYIIYIKMQTNMSYELNYDTILHVQNLSLSFINNSDTSYLNQSINSDSNELIKFCITIMQSIITNLVMIFVPFIILLTINWLMAMILMVFLVLYIMLNFAFKNSLFKASFALKESQSKHFSSLYEHFMYIKLIKINSIQPEMLKRLNKTFIDLRSKSIKNQKVHYIFTGLDRFIATISQITLFIVGGLQVLNGSLTIGMFTIFSTYFNMMMGASRYFLTLGASYQNTLVAYDGMNRIFREKQETIGTKLIKEIDTIKLENVKFSYNKKIFLIILMLNLRKEISMQYLDLTVQVKVL